MNTDEVITYYEKCPTIAGVENKTAKLLISRVLLASNK